MASIGPCHRKKSSSSPDLRHRIAYRKIANFKHRFIALIGAEGTGCNTIARRFLHMSDGPFQQPENKRYRKRSMLVDLLERPRIRRQEIIHLCVFLFNFHQLDFEALYLTVAYLNSCAVVFDVSSNSTLFTAIHCMVKITDLLDRSAPMFILIGNKIDLPRREVSPERANHMAEISGAQRYYGCSALMNINMDPVLDAILIMGLYSQKPPTE